MGSGRLCCRRMVRMAERYTLMDCDLWVCVRKVANSMRVSSETGMGEPLG